MCAACRKASKGCHPARARSATPGAACAGRASAVARCRGGGPGVDGHQGVGQGELASLGTGGQQSPGPGRAGGGKDRVHTAVTVAGLGHAAQALDGALGKVAAQQHLHDGAVRDVGVGGRCAASGQGGGEGAGVGQTAGTDGELAAQRLEAGAHPAGGGAARAEHGMRDAAPRAAVAVRVGDAAAQVPAARFGDVGSGQFGMVQGDGPLVGARVEVDAVAALAATAVLAGAQQVAGTGGGHPQGRGRWVTRALPSQCRPAGAGVGHMAGTVPGDMQARAACRWVCPTASSTSSHT